jgi:two-component system cell cycle response regulator
MTTPGGRVLVVDDERLNRMLLRRPLLAEGHTVTEAENGLAALEHLRTEPVDVVLLDLVMPELDGYATLEVIKADPALRHIPVIVVSGVDQLDSVVRCIEMGATDYLTKPFEVTILRARLDASLAAKRLRDLELEYLEQVSRVTGAASALEAGQFDPALLATVAARDDALGLLARRFATMAEEIRAREERLRREVRELRIEIDHARQAKRVAEITDTDFFRDLRSRAGELRKVIRTNDDNPGGETPGGETPGGETPGGETPGGETPGGETPGGEAGA